MNSAKTKRTRNIVIVHIILAVLAVIWLFPGFMSMVAVYFILKAVGLTEGIHR